MKTYFPKLRSAQVVEKALDRIVADEILGVIVGAPGCGRSASLRHWLRAHRDIPNIYIKACIGGTVTALVEALAEGLGVTKTSTHRTCAQIAKRLAARPVPVFLDEADFLCPSALNIARAIWDDVQEIRDTDDERGFPFALLGTHYLRTRLTQDEERAEQVYGRIGEVDEVPPLSLPETAGVLVGKWRFKLPPSIPGVSDELMALLDKPPAEGFAASLAGGSVEEIWKISNGSFRWVNKIVANALRIAAKDSKPITPKIIQAARRALAGLEEQ